VLFTFGIIALISVFFASRAWVTAERERFEHLEYLLATVGHDLRSPLQAIVGCAKLLRKSFAAGDNKTYVNIITDSSEQLAKLVDDLVSLARKEELSFEPHPLKLENWVNKIAARFTVDAEKKGLEFVVSMPNNLPTIMFDEIRLTQCVGNLLANAIRYTDSGAIKLAVNHLKIAENDLLLIDVEDTGPGIAEKDRKRIFMPFVRASSAAQGKGLGLAIAASIVRAAHGHISLKTTQGVGSTFSISLPVIYPENSTHETTSAAPSENQTNKAQVDHLNVLIVDDDPSLRAAFAGIVVDMGYFSDQASDGKEAFELANKKPYHAIITDIQMAGWDGFKLAQECRKKLHPCPILIAITAYTRALNNDPRAKLFDKILYKPVNDELLLAALESTPLVR
jgi:CheY-like chemotaxis protein